MPPPKNRPPFTLSTADVPETTHRYPKSEEPMGPARAIGRAAGLLKIGLHVQRALHEIRESPQAHGDGARHVGRVADLVKRVLWDRRVDVPHAQRRAAAAAGSAQVYLGDVHPAPAEDR